MADALGKWPVPPPPTPGRKPRWVVRQLSQRIQRANWYWCCFRSRKGLSRMLEHRKASSEKTVDWSPLMLMLVRNTPTVWLYAALYLFGVLTYSFLTFPDSFFGFSKSAGFRVEPGRPHTVTGSATCLIASCAHDLAWDVQIVIEPLDSSVRGLTIWAVKCQWRRSHCLLLILPFYYSQEVSNAAAVTDSLICWLIRSSIIQFGILFTEFFVKYIFRSSEVWKKHKGFKMLSFFLCAQRKEAA